MKQITTEIYQMNKEYWNQVSNFKIFDYSNIFPMVDMNVNLVKCFYYYHTSKNKSFSELIKIIVNKSDFYNRVLNSETYSKCLGLHYIANFIFVIYKTLQKKLNDLKCKKDFNEYLNIFISLSSSTIKTVLKKYLKTLFPNSNFNILFIKKFSSLDN